MKTLVMLDEQGGKHPVVLYTITHNLVRLLSEMPVPNVYKNSLNGNKFNILISIENVLTVK